MAYVDVKNQFIGILNRRDITPSLVDTFMTFAIQRIHTEIRVPFMEKTSVLTTDGSSQLAVPSDLLEVISIHTNDPTNHERLQKVDIQTILKYAQVPGSPQFYYREGSTFYIAPTPPDGTTVYLSYWSDPTDVLTDSTTNWLTETAPALLIYCALSFAADYFLDDRKALFEGSYLMFKEGLQNMALQDEVENASIASSFTA